MLQESIASLSRVAVVIRRDFAGIAELSLWGAMVLLL
jgi:hypothetical protein